MNDVSDEDLARGFGLIPQGWSERARLAFFDARVNEAVGDPHLRQAVEVVLRALGRPLDARGVLVELLAFVQLWVTFTPDRRGADTWQSPVRTFVRRRGDCEDMAMLFVACVRIARVTSATGFRAWALPIAARLVWLRQEGRDLDHVTAQGTTEGRIELGDRTHGGAWVVPHDETPVVMTSEATGDDQGPWQWAESCVAAELGEDPYVALRRLRGQATAVLGQVVA